jgi:protein-tyrosine phosphatase
MLSLKPFNEVAFGLFQGNTLYTKRGLKKAGIRTVINVSDHDDWQFLSGSADGIRYMHFPMQDNRLTENEYEAIRSAARMANRGLVSGNVLVHCDFGLNRSGVTVARALMFLGMSADEAIQEVRDARGSWALYNKDFTRWLKTEAVSNEIVS